MSSKPGQHFLERQTMCQARTAGLFQFSKKKKEKWRDERFRHMCNGRTWAKEKHSDIDHVQCLVRWSLVFAWIFVVLFVFKRKETDRTMRARLLNWTEKEIKGQKSQSGMIQLQWASSESSLCPQLTMPSQRRCLAMQKLLLAHRNWSHPPGPLFTSVHTARNPRPPATLSAVMNLSFCQQETVSWISAPIFEIEMNVFQNKFKFWS